MEYVRIFLDHSSAYAQLLHFILGANVEVRTNRLHFNVPVLVFLYILQFFIYPSLPFNVSVGFCFDRCTCICYRTNVNEIERKVSYMERLTTQQKVRSVWCTG